MAPRAGAAGALAATCDERPVEARMSGAVVSAHLVPTIGGGPASLDEAASLPDGTKLRLATTRF